MNIFNTARIFVLASLMTAAVAVAPVLGQSGQAAQPSSPPGTMGAQDIFDRLNLTPAQKQKIDNIRDSARPKMRSLEQQLTSKDRELQAAFQNGNFNQSLATQKLTEMAPIQAQLMGENFRMRNEIMAVLNPQQKSRFERFEQQAREQGQGYPGGQ